MDEEHSLSWSAMLLLPVIILFISFTLYKSYKDSNIPGPILNRLTSLPLLYHRTRGRHVQYIHALHHQYGPIVRVAPREISYTHPDASKEIYGSNHPGLGDGHQQLPKDKSFYGPDFYASSVDEYGIFRAEGAVHATQRRVLRHAFSEGALRQQEPIILEYVRVLVDEFRECSKRQEAVNLVDWYNFATFDIMGDLTFGKSLGLLESGRYSQWVAAVFLAFKQFAIGQTIQTLRLSWLYKRLLQPADTAQKIQRHLDYVTQNVDARLAQDTERPDFWTSIVTKRQSNTEAEIEGMTIAQQHSFGSTAMIAGTETTATLLSGLTYLLLSNPGKLERLVAEIRSAFPDTSDMQGSALKGLEYLNACIEEAFRLYPPISVGPWRVVPSPGTIICGQFVPGGTTVYVSQYSTYRSPSNFHAPDQYLPERWLGSSKDDGAFQNDQRHALQPFSYGPRNCIGKTLAYCQVRLILAHVLYHFDLSPARDTDLGDWADQRVFTVWEKRPLLVNIKAV